MMKVSTSTSNIVVRFGIEKAMSIIGDAGFEAIDFGMFHLPPDGDAYTKWDKNEFAGYFKSVKREADKNGLEVFQCHAPFPLKVYNDEKDEMLLNCAIKSIYASAYLGCKYIVVHPAMKSAFIYGRNYEECRRTNFEFYTKMVPALKETGVVMCIENMFAGDPETGKRIPTTCSRVEWMIDFIDGLNELHGGDMFAACLDTGHALISGSGPTHMLTELGARTKILHVQDNDGLTDMHQAPGRGKTDWMQFLKALKEVGYNGTFNFETDNHYAQWNNNELYGEKVCRAAAATLYAIGRNFADIVTAE